MDFFNKLRSLLRFGVVSGPTDNSKQFPVQLVSYKGKTSQALMLFPYGVFANIPVENSLALVFSVEGSDGNKAAMAYTPTARPLTLQPGELCIYHPITGSTITLLNSGEVRIVAPETRIQSNLTLEGNLNCLGSASFTSNITSNGKNIGDTHSHTGSPTAPDGPISPTGGVI